MISFQTIIGRAETIDIVGWAEAIPAKVDTGALSSAISASNIHEKDGELHFTLFDKHSRYYAGKEIVTKQYQTVNVENSFGHSQERYGVELRVSFCGKKFKTFFTLSDRSQKIYPVLVGRKLLKGRFLVDVTKGHPVSDEMTEENLGFEGLKHRL